MALFIDARIPVVFGETPGPADAVLEPEEGWAAEHPVGCACCVARGPVALSLDRLFLGRVRGDLPWFERVVVPASGEAPVRAALACDSVASARFRLS
jgi:hypothetical protein